MSIKCYYIKHMKIKHYQKNKLGNVLHTIKIALSPSTPKNKRKTLAQVHNRNTFRKRQAKLLEILKK